MTGFDLAKGIKIQLLGLYGETDQNPKPEDAKRFGELLKQLPRRLPAVAGDAWKRCDDFLKKNLSA